MFVEENTNLSLTAICHGKLDQIGDPDDTLTQILFNVGPLSATLAQHWLNIGSVYRVCWDIPGWNFQEVICQDRALTWSLYLWII